MDLRISVKADIEGGLTKASRKVVKEPTAADIAFAKRIRDQIGGQAVEEFLPPRVPKQKAVQKSKKLIFPLWLSF